MTDPIKQRLLLTPSLTQCPPAILPRHVGEILSLRAAQMPDALAFAFMGFGRVPDVMLSYGELHARALAIARQLLMQGQIGDRIMLVFPTAMGFIEAFFACMYAGRVAVPALPPRTAREAERLVAMVEDCQPGMLLSGESDIESLAHFLHHRTDHAPPCLSVEEVTVSGPLPGLHQPAARGLAYLQYTSGSAAVPRGVMVGHGQLLHNQALLTHHMGSDQNRRWLMVSWLPHFHDMGLVAGILHPLFVGRPCVLFSPEDFMQQPLRWLRVISGLQATCSGAPDFAYTLCIRRAKRGGLAGLDLSSWDHAFSGAEPVRHTTLLQFAETMAVTGFCFDAFAPAYGLAEATLLVAGKVRGDNVVVRHADYDALTMGQYQAPHPASRVVRLVGCGNLGATPSVQVLDPISGSPMPTGQLGEICLQGESVCQGYWAQPVLSGSVFGAYRWTADGSGWLRTGDMGLVDEAGNLFVFGRLKEVVISDGAKFYPPEIEQVISDVDSAVRPGRVAVFNIDMLDTAAVIAVCEVTPVPEMAALAARIQAEVQSQCLLNLNGVVLIGKGQIPLTSSGKIRRFACRHAFLEGELAILYARLDEAVPGNRRKIIRRDVQTVDQM